MEKKTIYHIILDQSGSMADCIQQTISGFNEQLQVIKKLESEFLEQKILVGLTRFNDTVMPTCFGQPVNQIKPLSVETYVPNGTTALLDAIGSTCLRITEDFANELKEDTTVVIVILTDGYENASRRFTSKAIKDLISELEGTGKWTFTYLGATIDAVETASALNIKSRNSRSFNKTEMNESYEMLSSSLHTYLQQRRSGMQPQDFLPDDSK